MASYQDSWSGMWIDDAGNASWENPDPAPAPVSGPAASPYEAAFSFAKEQGSKIPYTPNDPAKRKYLTDWYARELATQQPGPGDQYGDEFRPERGITGNFFNDPNIANISWEGNRQRITYLDETSTLNAPYEETSPGPFGGGLYDAMPYITAAAMAAQGAIAAPFIMGGAGAGAAGAAGAGAGFEAGFTGAGMTTPGLAAGGIGGGSGIAAGAGLAGGFEAGAIGPAMEGGALMTAADAALLAGGVGAAGAGGRVGAATPVAAAATPGILSKIGSGIVDNPGASILAGLAAGGLVSGGSLMGSSPEATTSPGGTKYTPEQQSLLKAYTDYYAGIAGDTATPGYTGNRVAPINEAQQRAEDLLMGYTPFAKTDLGMGASGTLQDVMAGGSGKYFEDQFKNVVEDPMLRNWTESIVPELTGTFAKKGLLYGTGREEATLKAGTSLAETLAMGRSDLALKMELQRLAGVTGATQMGSLGLDETTGVSSGLSLTGAQKQVTGQKQADADYEAWLRTQPGSRPQDPVIQSILGLSPYYEPSTVVSGGEAGMLGPLLNAAAIYYGQRRP